MDEVRQVAHDAHVPADFQSVFRRRFAPLFGRKIGRQRSEQYLGGLLGGRAERRNVTSLAGTVDGATARALGWLLTKSPWPTRPVVDALQAYVGDTFGAPDGLFTLNLDSFVKRGDNAVGVERQFVHHLGRPQNCQIGVFLAYGTEQASALVDAALYMPRAWIDSASRRHKAGVPESIEYQSRSALAVELLRRTRAAGHLPGSWVTTWRGEGFEADLGARLDAEGWRYLLPIPASSPLYPSPDASAAQPAAQLLTAQASCPLKLRRVWLPSDPAAEGSGAGPASWLLGCTDALTGKPVAFVSNGSEDAALERFEQIVAARWVTARMLAERCAGVSLDVYRVRGWDGWHRHVALALLASAFRACLPIAASAPAPADEVPAFSAPVVLRQEDAAPTPALIPFPPVAAPTVLLSRTSAQETGLMPAFEGVAGVIGNAIGDASRTPDPSHALVPAHAANGHANGHTNGHSAGPEVGGGNGGGTLESLAAPTGTPTAPPAGSPARPTAPPRLSMAPTSLVVPAEDSLPDTKLDGRARRRAEEQARPPEEQMVVLDVGDEWYGIPVQRVREIIRVPSITRVPNGPTFLEGVINLRGQVIPVMDLRKHLGIPSRDRTGRSRVVVSELGRHTVGLMVDGVSQVVMVATASIEPVPSLIASANDGQIRGVARLGDRLVLFLDPDRLLTS